MTSCQQHWFVVGAIAVCASFLNLESQCRADDASPANARAESPQSARQPDKAASPTESRAAAEATQAIDGLKLVARTDLIYVWKHEKAAEKPPTDRKKQRGSGKPARKERPKEAAAQAPYAQGKGLFQVLRNGKPPKDGFFDVGGKPVAPEWESSDNAVLKVVKSRESGEPYFVILAAGKTTVTARVGSWSDKAELTVAEGPFTQSEEQGMNAHKLTEALGYPAKKYGFRRNANPRSPAGFEVAPKGLLELHWNPMDSFSYHGPNQAEFWEYEKWPRCLIPVGGSGPVTRPATPGEPKAVQKRAEQRED